MQTTKIIIVYTSIHHGNTEKVAQAMALSLNADITKTDHVTPEMLRTYDLIGFGSGIYFGRHHKQLFKLIDQLPLVSAKKAFIFSTSGQGKTSLHKKLNVELVKKGFEVIGSFACKGYDTFGPLKLFGGIAKGRPNEEDLQKARTFAENLRI